MRTIAASSAEQRPPLTLYLDGEHRSYLEVPDVDTRAEAISPAGKAPRATPSIGSFVESSMR